MAAPETELVPIDSLHPLPTNARIHTDRNLEVIRNSLTTFGQQKAILVTRDNMILAGHGLWTAAKQLGWTEIKVERSNLTGERARAYALADNRAGELSAWDTDLLAMELLAIAEQVVPDLIGFGSNELDAVLGRTVADDVQFAPLDDSESPKRLDVGRSIKCPACGHEWNTEA